MEDITREEFVKLIINASEEKIALIEKILKDALKDAEEENKQE